MTTTTIRPNWTAPIEGLVNEVFSQPVAVTDREADPFKSAGDFANWCMSGNTGDAARGIIRDVPNFDPEGEFLTAVHEAIEERAERIGLGRINEGLAAPLPAVHSPHAND